MITFHSFHIRLGILLATLCLCLPAVARAQSLAGTVRDSSGGVLPGVSVEAASPALIERSRSVVTDANGQYQIVRVKGTRANVGLDLYNLTNANTPTAVEGTYDPASGGERWFRPTAVLQPRFMRLNVQFDF